MRYRRLLILCFLLLIAGDAHAQEPSPFTGSDQLAALLHFVPAITAPRIDITLSYGDYRAADYARGIESDSAAIADPLLWEASLPAGGMDLSHIGDFWAMPLNLGIEFRDIDQSLAWGDAPNDAVVLHGHFDVEAVRAAHQAQGFVESAVGDAPLWCAAEGCDAGFLVDLDHPRPADVFNGARGQRYPRALAGDFFFGAGSERGVRAVEAAGAGGAASLMDNPVFQAAVAALDGDYALRAVQFARPFDFLALTLDGLATDATDEQVAAYQEALRGGENTLPVFNLAFLADAADSAQELALVGLVYADADAAATAADLLTTRLALAQSAEYSLSSWQGLITSDLGSIQPVTVLSEPDSGHSVVMVTLTKPLPPNRPDAEGHYVPSGALFRLLLAAYQARDLGWLQPAFELPPTSPMG